MRLIIRLGYPKLANGTGVHVVGDILPKKCHLRPRKYLNSISRLQRDNAILKLINGVLTTKIGFEEYLAEIEKKPQTA
jgi:hypothetical protein